MYAPPPPQALPTAETEEMAKASWLRLEPNNCTSTPPPLPPGSHTKIDSKRCCEDLRHTLRLAQHISYAVTDGTHAHGALPTYVQQCVTRCPYALPPVLPVAVT